MSAEILQLEREIYEFIERETVQGILDTVDSLHQERVDLGSSITQLEGQVHDLVEKLKELGTTNRKLLQRFDEFRAQREADMVFAEELISLIKVLESSTALTERQQRTLRVALGHFQGDQL